MLKKLYSKLWVPIMGRFIYYFVPFLEGKPPQEVPTYDIDGKKKFTK
tara:strand:+ start:1275 stop:1415 length:141 start_codon:yes stop_codon:yes gene_type:complete